MLSRVYKRRRKDENRILVVYGTVILNKEPQTSIGKYLGPHTKLHEVPGPADETDQGSPFNAARIWVGVLWCGSSSFLLRSRPVMCQLGSRSLLSEI